MCIAHGKPRCSRTTLFLLRIDVACGCTILLPGVPGSPDIVTPFRDMSEIARHKISAATSTCDVRLPPLRRSSSTSVPTNVVPDALAIGLVPHPDAISWSYVPSSIVNRNGEHGISCHQSQGLRLLGGQAH